MPRVVAAIQTWAEDGSLRAVARIEDADLVDVRAACGDLSEQVSAALAGRSSTVAAQYEGRPIECTLGPLIERGRIGGAIAVLTYTTRSERASEELRTHIAMEELVTALSTKFVGLAGDAIDAGLDEALGAIGAFANVDRAYIFRFTADGTLMVNTHEWCAPGIEAQIDALQELKVEDFPWWSRMLKAREVIHVPDVATMPPDAVSAQTVLRAQGIRSVLVIPMICEDKVTGFVGFDAVRSKKNWPKRDIVLLRIAGEIFAGALERARADRERHHLHVQLVQARSLESVARLAGGIAHEFNNLLAVILNYATLLKRQLEKPSQREMLGELSETARRAAELTRQLLLVGRRDVVDPVLLDLSSVVRSLEPLLDKTVGDAIELRLDVGDDLDIVRIGLPQIEQIILNLALNARDAMPGGGSLVIRTENVDITPGHASRFIDVRPGRCVRLRVADSGTGMSPEVASRAFDPFFTTKGPQGVGLGLATVHGIVKHAGGHVVLTAAPGAGTTVDVYLPAVVAVSDPAAAAADASAPLVSSPVGRGETVLVVDDSQALRRLVCRLLAASRYRAFEGGTVEEAVAVCEKLGGRLDLLLTDVRMPSVSGRELAARLRTEYGVMRVLYMSGDGADIVTHEVGPEGMRLIQKPFVEDDLLRAVRDALDARRDPEKNNGSVTA